MVTKASLNYTSDKDEALQRQSIILTSSEIWDFFSVWIYRANYILFPTGKLIKN